MPNRIAVIGGVASGPAAAAEAKRTEPDADVVLFEAGPHVSYGACEIPYYLSGVIRSVDELVVFSPERLEREKGVQVRVRHRVDEIDAGRGHVWVTDLGSTETTRQRFDSVVLATGARPVVPDVPGADATGVFSIRTLGGAIDLANFAHTRSIRHVVVAGGGLVGLEMADALHRRGYRTTVLEPGAWLLNGYLDEPLARIVEEAALRAGIQIRRERIAAIERDAGDVVGHVVTDRRERIGCQMVVMATGIRANVELATNAGVRLGTTGAIAVDRSMRTSIPRLWACGDCIEVPRSSDGVSIYAPLSPTAFRTGRIAGHNAARRGRGRHRSFSGVTPAYGVDAFGLQVGIAGRSLSDARRTDPSAFGTVVHGTSRAGTLPGGGDVCVSLVVSGQTGQLLGAQVVGQEGAAWRANVVVPLIRGGEHVSMLRDLDLIYAPPFGPSIDPLIRAASRAQDRLQARRSGAVSNR